jgi:hypothetical protein
MTNHLITPNIPAQQLIRAFARSRQQRKGLTGGTAIEYGRDENRTLDRLELSRKVLK